MRTYIVHQKNSARIFPDQMEAAKYLDGPNGFKADDTTTMLQMNVISDEELSRLNTQNAQTLIQAELKGQKEAYLAVIKSLIRNGYES